MNGSEIITQLKACLPSFTDKFSANINIVSITSVGLVATATTASAHGLAIGHVVNIVGALSPVDITSISRTATIATVTTTQDHDLTDGFFTTVTLAGVSESEFNGTFTFLNQVNRKTFTFTVVDSGPTSATGGQLTDPGAVGGYNGLKVVASIPTTTTFTYPLTFTQPNAAFPNTGQLRQGIRITGAVNHERALQLYSEQNTNDFWAFIILEDVVASKDRHGMNDAISSSGPAGSRRQQIIQPFIVEVFSDASNDVSGQNVRDNMEQLASSIFKCLVGFKADTLLSEGSNMGIYFLNSGTIDFDTSVYVYGWRFELLGNIENPDTVADDFNVAFRDIGLTMNVSTGNEPLTASLNLDDQPLP